MANQNDRDRAAIRTVLRQMARPTSYQDISLRGGERLASALMEMVAEGEVVRTEPAAGEPALYHLSPSHAH